MWPILIRTLRVYAPYITLPFAAMVGVIGYNLENYFSDKYTPYNGKTTFFCFFLVNLLIIFQRL